MKFLAVLCALVCPLSVLAASAVSTAGESCSPYVDPASPPESLPKYNQHVLSSISLLKSSGLSGGVYGTSKKTSDFFMSGAKWSDERNDFDFSGVSATTASSMCSTATYLVFLKTLSQSHESSPALLKSLTPRPGPDGVGAWGWWNANGPGTAALFKRLGLGSNTDSLSNAKPGDFMKIWWNDSVGAKEAGHSVVFLGCQNWKGKDYLCFWSSNTSPKGSRAANLAADPKFYPPQDNSQTGGYSVRCAPRSDVKRVLASRLENPAGSTDKPFGQGEKNEDLMNLNERRDGSSGRTVPGANYEGSKATEYLRNLLGLPTSDGAGGDRASHDPSATPAQ